MNNNDLDTLKSLDRVFFIPEVERMMLCSGSMEVALVTNRFDFSVCDIVDLHREIKNRPIEFVVTKIDGSVVRFLCMRSRIEVVLVGDEPKVVLIGTFGSDKNSVDRLTEDELYMLKHADNPKFTHIHIWNRPCDNGYELLRFEMDLREHNIDDTFGCNEKEIED